MSLEPSDWISLATGISGFLFGCAGAILGWLGYSTSKKMKATDLRIELKSLIQNARLELGGLEEQIVEGNKSRIAVLAAIGKYNSGDRVVWETKIATDNETVLGLKESIPDSFDKINKMPPELLENEIVHVRTVLASVGALRKSYSEAYSYDDTQRDHLRRAAERKIGLK